MIYCQCGYIIVELRTSNAGLYLHSPAFTFVVPTDGGWLEVGERPALLERVYEFYDTKSRESRGKISRDFSRDFFDIFQSTK